MRNIVKALLGVAMLCSCVPGSTQELKYRWFYVMQNLQVTENVPKLQQLMRRAKAAGYNGMVLADYKLNILDRVPDHYFRNAEAIKATAKELGLGLYPAVFGIGYSNGLLAHDPNLAEGLPVRGARFVVKGRSAQLESDAPPVLKGGGFEEGNGNRASGWDYQDDPGRTTFLDTSVKHGGNSSLRMQDLGGSNGRVHQLVALKPWRQYAVHFWVKTEDFVSAGDVRCAVLTEDGGSLSFAELGVKRSQDWTEYHVVFNSRKYSQARIYLGVWGGRSGRLWFDDARMEEAGLLNVLRRSGCPLQVVSETGNELREGVDFETVKDPKLGNVPYAGEYSVWHEAPSIRLTPNSRIKDGQVLRVSFYHVQTVMEGQVAACLSEPKVYEILRDQCTRVVRLFGPPGLFFSHDEMRQSGWCALCSRPGASPGQLLAENMRRCVETAKSILPGGELFVWNDMFDPFHNAVDRYYLTNGTLAGSWEGLPKEVVVVNWHFGRRKENMPWFASRGNRQILAGYYDGSPASIRQWLNDSKGVAGIVGVMYTTWVNNFNDLEAFAEYAWGSKRQ
jgi:hypothetical protein